MYIIIQLVAVKILNHKQPFKEPIEHKTPTDNSHTSIVNKMNKEEKNNSSVALIAVQYKM